MENVFENACFGKAYLTRDGRKAIYMDSKCDSHWVIVEGTSYIWEYMDDGTPEEALGCSSTMDIVSEWRETVDDEEVDRIARLEADRYCKESNCGHIMPNDWEIAHDCIKIGYLKAIDGTR